MLRHRVGGYAVWRRSARAGEILGLAWPVSRLIAGVFPRRRLASAQTQRGQRFTRVVKPANEVLPLLEFTVT